MVDMEHIQEGIMAPLIENEEPSQLIQNIVSHPSKRQATKIGDITSEINNGSPHSL